VLEHFQIWWNEHFSSQAVVVWDEIQCAKMLVRDAANPCVAALRSSGTEEISLMVDTKIDGYY
jgi:hypothetical protein